LGDIFFIHFCIHAQWLWFTNPEKCCGGIHNLSHLGIAAQHHAGGGGANDIIIQPSSRCFRNGAHGAGFGLCPVKRGAGGDIARDQGAYAPQIFLGEACAGFGFLYPVLSFTVIQLRHGLASFHSHTFFY
jgi:hypothetical protein